MARHRAGDRRILSISIPEKLAKRLDRQVGRGREKGRSATIARLVELGMAAEASAPDLDVEVEPRVAGGAAGEVRICLLYKTPSPRDLSTHRMPPPSRKKKTIC